MNLPAWHESRVHYWTRALVNSDHDEVTKHVGLTLAAYVKADGVRGTMGADDLDRLLPYGEPDTTAALSALVEYGWLRLRNVRSADGSAWTRYSLRDTRAHWSAPKGERLANPRDRV